MSNNNNTTTVISQKRFVELWQRCADNYAADAAATLYKDITQHYSSSARKYHNLNHIEHCIKQLDLAKSHYQREIVDTVEMALWFHDVIYDAGAEDNEQQSADWFVLHGENVISNEVIESVCRLILSTRHRQMPERADEKYLVDIDLSSFGMPWNQFLNDSHAVRAEYTHLSDVVFYKGHRRFLKYLLNRESIYSSEYFKTHYEQNARDNISGFLEVIVKRLKSSER